VALHPGHVELGPPPGAIKVEAGLPPSPRLRRDETKSTVRASLTRGPCDDGGGVAVPGRVGALGPLELHAASGAAAGGRCAGSGERRAAWAPASARAPSGVCLGGHRGRDLCHRRRGVDRARHPLHSVRVVPGRGRARGWSGGQVAADERQRAFRCAARIACTSDSGTSAGT
jgi:hypothetical protein